MNRDGESLLVNEREGRWWAQGIDRTKLVADAADLDALRPAILEAASATRRDEGLGDRPWKIAYLWGVDVAPRPKGLLGSVRSLFGSKPDGPVFEVSPTADGYVGRAEDGSSLSGTTLAELNERARQRYAPVGAETAIASITLFEILELPPARSHEEP